MPPSEVPNDVSIDTNDQDNLFKDAIVEITEQPKADDKAAAATELAKQLEVAARERDEEKAKRKDEEGRRLAAETRAANAERTVAQERTNTTQLRTTNLESSIDQSEKQLVANEQQWTALMNEGKFADAAKLNSENTKLATRIEQMKSQYDSVKSAPAQTQTQNDPTTSPTYDPHTKAVYTKATWDWIQKHNDRWSDADFRADAFGADVAAQQRGIKPDSSAYFKFVEERMGLDKDDPVIDDAGKEVLVEAPKQQQQAQVRATSAPPARNGGTAQVRKDKVALTADQREMARYIKDTLPEQFGDEDPDVMYAKNVQALKEEKGDTWWLNN